MGSRFLNRQAFGGGQLAPGGTPTPTPAPSPTMSLSSAVTQAEGNTGTAAFVWTLTLNRNGSTAAVPYSWAVTGNGASPADAADFGGAFPSGSGTFAAGETSKTITVLVAGDTAVEPNETFLLTVAAAGLASVTSTGTISNDDVAAPTPTVAISAAQSINEGNSGATLFTYTVTRSTAIGAVVVPWSFTAGTTDAADFTGGVLPAGGNVNMADGVATGTIVISVNGDATVESNEAFTVLISTPSGYVAGAATSATGTVLNDDSAGAPTYLPTVSSAPLAVVGMKRLISGYSGNLFTLRRDTDSATMDVPAKAGSDLPDYAAISTWGTAANLYIVTMYDQTGNGKNATMATAANQPFFDLNETLAGCVPMIAASQPDNVSRYLASATTLAFNRTNVSMIGVVDNMGGRSDSVLYRLTAGGTTNITLYQATNNNGVQINDGAPYDSGIAGMLRAQPSVVGYTSNGTDRRLFNREQITAAGSATTALAGTQYWLGSAGAAAFQANCRYYGFALYPALSDADMILVRNALTAQFVVPTAFDRRIVFDGDSITWGLGSSHLRNMVKQATINGAPELFNGGCSGSGLTLLNTNYAAHIAPLFTSAYGANKCILSIAAGTNDLNGTSTAAQIETQMSQYVSAAHATGFKVDAATILPRSTLTGTKETYRTTFNAWMTGGNSGADVVVDIASESHVQNTADTTIYVDGTHLTSQGYGYVAPLYSTAINGLTGA